MKESNGKSRLFQASPDQLLLDERVSKIVLPRLDADRAQIDEREANWGLGLQDEDETEVTEKLSLFVGGVASSKQADSTEVATTEWDISEDDLFYDDMQFEEDVPVPMNISLNQVQPVQPEVRTEGDGLTSPPPFPLHSIQEIDASDEELAQEASTVEDGVQHGDAFDDWSKINWDGVSLSDILGADILDGDELSDEEVDGLGTKLSLFDEDSNEDTEAVFTAHVSTFNTSLESTDIGSQVIHSGLDDIPSWDEPWDDEEDGLGAKLIVDDEWFSENEVTIREVGEVADTVPSLPTYAQPTRLPPPRIYVKSPPSIWEDKLVVMWVLVLAILVVSALIWRLLHT